MLLHRRSREVYRVYSEEEYLNGAGSELGGIGAWTAAEPQIGEFELGELPFGEPSLGEWPTGIEPGMELTREGPVGVEPAGEWATAPASDWATEVQPPATGSVGIPTGELYDGFAEPQSKPVRERRLRRVAGVAVLLGAIGTVGGLVVLNLTRANGGGGRRGSLVAATRSSRAVRSPTGDDAQPRVISSRPALVRPVETVRPRVPQLGRRGLGGSGSHRSGNLHADRPSRWRGDVGVIADYVPRRSSSAASAAPVLAPAAASAAPVPASVSTPAQASTTTTTEEPPPAPQAPEKRSEFGFER